MKMKQIVLWCLVLIHTKSMCQVGYSRDELISRLMNDFLLKTKVPGISVAVSKKGEIHYAEGFGYADLENNVEMQATTRIRAASVSKMITITAIARLVTEGKLDLDAPIKKYIPYLKEPFTTLTTRQITNHTSGIPHRPTHNKSKKKNYNSTRELVELVEETTLRFTPGSKYEYSSLAYNLLAGVIEGASGKNYLDYIQEDIFKPLGMERTAPDEPSEVTKNEARMYLFKKGKLILDKKYFNGSYKLPGAGFKSTSVDLVKMMEGYMNGFISSSVAANLFSNTELPSGDKTNVGVGWRIGRDIVGRETVGHAGSWQGARTVIVHYPKEQLTVSLMINAQCNIFIEETAHTLAQLFLQEELSNKNLKALERKIIVEYTDENDQPSTAYGNVLMSKEGFGKLIVNEDIKLLKQNNLFYLGTDNLYALSSEFGLLFLTIDYDPSFEGKLYLYQARDLKREPMFTLK